MIFPYRYLYLASKSRQKSPQRDKANQMYRTIFLLAFLISHFSPFYLQHYAYVENFILATLFPAWITWNLNNFDALQNLLINTKMLRFFRSREWTAGTVSFVSMQSNCCTSGLPQANHSHATVITKLFCHADLSWLIFTLICLVFS